MASAICPRCKRQVEGLSAKGLCAACLAEEGRCLACGEELDQFTKCAYIAGRPGSVCLECREAERPIVLSLPQQPIRRLAS